jgi:hypothetical protein
VRRESCRDVVVVVPGIMGSKLAVDGNLIWALSGSALWRGLRTLGGSVRRLELPAELGDEHPGDGVEAVGLMPGLHVIPGVWSPITGYARLVDWLEQNFTLTRYDSTRPDEPANLVEFPYDWRLSNRYTARRLRATVTPILERWQAASPDNRDARLVLICHSMGGLVARQFLAVEGGAELTGKVLTLGTPYRGSVAALASLVNGSGGFSRLARSMPSLHQLLPAYDSVVAGADLRHHRTLAMPPGVNSDMVNDAADFHAHMASELARAGTPPYQLRAVVGLRQPTDTTAVVDGDKLRLLREIRGEDEGGDGRVPRLSARPPELAGDDPALRGPRETHGALPDNASVREVIWEWLTARQRVHRGPEDAGGWLGVDAPELVPTGQPWAVEVTGSTDTMRVQLSVSPPDAAAPAGPCRTLRNLGDGQYAIEVEPLPDGPYVLRVSAHGVPAVTTYVLVGWDGPA